MKKVFAVLALAVFALLGGCGGPMQKPLPDSKVLPMPGNVALKSIVVAREVLAGAYDFIAVSVNGEMLEPKQGRAWFVQLDGYKDKLGEAEKLFSAGNFDAARLQAEGTQALIKLLHDQAIEAVKKKNRGSTRFDFAPEPPALLEAWWRMEIQPARRLAWIR